MDEKNTRNNRSCISNGVLVDSDGTLNASGGDTAGSGSDSNVGSAIHQKQKKKVVDVPQFDDGMMALPCRSVASSQIFLERRLPENIKRSLERHKISLSDAIYYARVMKRKESRLSKGSFDEFWEILRSLNYIRRDFKEVSFAYVKLMRDAGIPNKFIAGISEITDNEMYETCLVPGVDDMKAFDLRIENRMSYRAQFILRKIYGLDGERYSTYDVAAIYNKIVMEGKSKEYFEHRKDFLTRINVSRVEITTRRALEKLREKRDDKHEYIAKLAERLYNATKMPEDGEKKEFDDALIESLAGDILLTVKRF